ncbi:MAG TPA: cytochrome c [Longimicrobiales bacterium]
MTVEPRFRRAAVTALVAVCGAALGRAAPVHAQSSRATAAKAAFAVDTAKARAGAGLWEAKGCNACHGIGEKQVIVGPDLAGVFERRERAWLERWLKEPDLMQRSDSIGKALLAEYNNIPMPNLGLTDEEIEALLHYIALESAKARAVSGGTP